MLKGAAFYLEKQKSFIPKKNFLSCCQYQNKKLCLLTQFSVKVLVQILVHSHFELVSSLLALDANELVSQPVTQMAIEMINIHLISVWQFHLITVGFWPKTLFFRTRTAC